jgi:Undecaprenyl-phosphate galactose phosphotransferase WbaP
MSTLYGGNADVDFEALDVLFEADDSKQTRTEGFFRRSIVDAPFVDAPLVGVPLAVPRIETPRARIDGEDWVTADSQALSTQFHRLLRTIAPFVFSDLLALTVSGLFAQTILWLISPVAASHLGWEMPAILLPLIAAYWISGLYTEVWIHPVIELRHLTHLNTICLLAVAIGGMWVPPLPLWFTTAWMAAVVLVPFSRAMARRCCAGRSWWGYPTLVIGSGDGADALARALVGAPNSALRPVLITDPQGTCRVSILPVVDNPAMLQSMIRAQGIQHAVISLPEFSAARLSRMLDQYGDLIPHLLVLSDVTTLPTLWGTSRSSGRLSGIEIRNGLLLATLQWVKRGFDLTIALIVLCLSLPAILAIMGFAKLSDRGSVFFGHTRIGRHGRSFKAWKFRTMRSNSDAVLEAYLRQSPQAQAEWDRDHKLRNDPRVTRFGRFLRRTSLDELPQLWNVIKGDMSFVGPRPIVREEIARYGEAFRLYANVKPGITGLWQVSGRNDIGYEDRVQLDLFYVRHWSPWLDLYILGKTFIALASRDGAY